MTVGAAKGRDAYERAHKLLVVPLAWLVYANGIGRAVCLRSGAQIEQSRSLS